MSSQIEKLIVKFITKSATAQDLDALSVWIENPSNFDVFREFVKTHYTIIYKMNDPDTDKLVETLLSKIRKDKSIYRKFKPKKTIISIAATIVILLGAFFAANNITNRNTSISSQNDEAPKILDHKSIKPGENKGILTLADGSQIALESNINTEIANVKSDGEKIIYDTNNSSVEKIEFNYLTIPRAGQFMVKLSDGTQVWLNSESQLKYPVKFNYGTTRKVELVYGEAFFDVASSKLNGNSKFIVINGSQEIEVLGTEFNVKAYKNEANIYTTLAEGSVRVKIGGTSNNKVLKPNQQLSFNKDNGNLLVRHVDVYNEIAWKEGIFSFEDKTLKEMMTVLSRWYDVDIIFENTLIEEEQFFGILRKNQTLDEILSSIKNFGIIKNFKITENEIIIQ